MPSNIQLILDPTSDDETLARAVARLLPTEASSKLWTDIANSPSYRIAHRALAIGEVLGKYLVRPSSLAEMASLLSGAAWLADAVIEKMELMGGEPLVAIPPGGAGYVVRLAETPPLAGSAPAVYLALDHDLEPADLRDALMGADRDPSLARIRVIDVACFPGPRPVEPE